MSEINDGGPAFPRRDWIGMTLREWFAGMVIQGLASQISSWNFGTTRKPRNPYKNFAKVSFEIADAMIKAGEES